MALECYVGPEQNLLESTEHHAHRLRIPHPILTNDELASLKHMDHRGWRTKTVDITYPAGSGRNGLLDALDRINAEAREAIDEGYSLIILSDRETSQDRVPLSSLLAVGSVHQHLVKDHARARIGLVLESGEAREVHHHCLLVGYGADAINPYLAFESLWDSRAHGYLDDAPDVKDDAGVVRNYKKAVAKGMLKVMAKMGISTLQSYKGAQIFEAVGLASEVVDLAFAGTASRVEGVGFDILAEEMQRKHDLGFPARDVTPIAVLPNPGDFHWRRHGDTHMWDPETVAKLQVAARQNSEDAYWAFARYVNEENTRRANLRGLLGFADGQNSVDLEEVEPESEIVETVCDRRDELRLDQRGSARISGHRDEPSRRQVEHRRRR